MLKAALVIQFIILLIVPVAVGFWLRRQWALSWILFFGGALAFVSAWIITSFFPIGGEVSLLLSSIVEMGALYLIYRYQLKTVKTEREAIMVGAGLAGMELIIVGIFTALSFTQMLPLRTAPDQDLIEIAARADGVSEEEVEPERIDELRELVDDYWNRSWYVPLLQTTQPLTFLPIQAVLAVVVLGALVQSDLRPLVGAMALHFLSRILPIFGGIVGGLVIWLGLSLVFGGFAIWYLRRLWPTIQQETAKASQARRKAEKKT